jgi:hypothetical protein
MEKLPQHNSKASDISAHAIFAHYIRNETQVTQSNKSSANKVQIKTEWKKGPFYNSSCPY